MRALDRRAIEELGIPSLVLMETAGRAVASAAESLLAEARRVLVVAGRGNNGGDGVVAARALSDRGIAVRVVLVGSPLRSSADLAHQLEIARRLGLRIDEPEGSELEVILRSALEASDVVIDALFGTGLARAVSGDAETAVRLINASGRRVVSADLPSGIDADTGQILGVAVRAEITVTFAFAKLGHVTHPGRELTGHLEIADIGIPRSLLDAADAEILSDTIIELARPSRAPDSHKGTFGHLGIVAGAPDRPGAALLAARAGLRTGAGLVTLLSEPDVIGRLAPELVEVMGVSIPLVRDILSSNHIVDAVSSRRINALVLGPSLDPARGLERVLREVLPGVRAPVVLDAGALDALGSDPSWLREHKEGVVLTPHPGEMARIARLDTASVQGARVDAARGLAEASGATVILKGSSTVIADPEGRVSFVTRGHAGMATAGSGDVLSGIIGALLAQGAPVSLAARAGAQLHGRAGDAAKQRRGTRLIASDLIDALAEAE